MYFTIESIEHNACRKMCPAVVTYSGYSPFRPTSPDTRTGTYPTPHCKFLEQMHNKIGLLLYMIALS